MSGKKSRNQEPVGPTGGASERDDRLTFDGTVEETLPGTLFRVKCTLGNVVLCALSGKMRMNHIRLLPGDAVRIETSPYDVSRGRVVYRLR
jgi:translation initiation factor IF-1